MAAKLRPETDIPGLYLTGQVNFTVIYYCKKLVGVVVLAKVQAPECTVDLCRNREFLPYANFITVIFQKIRKFALCEFCAILFH